MQHRCGVLLILESLLLATPGIQAIQISAHADNSKGLRFTVLDDIGREVMQSYPSALAFHINGRWFVTTFTVPNEFNNPPPHSKVIIQCIHDAYETVFQIYLIRRPHTLTQSPLAP